MVIDKTLAKVSRQHTVYKLADGTRVPGVTTVLNEMAKPALIPWANKMGLQGIDTTKYVDAAANVGKCCHAMIESHLKGGPFVADDYSPDAVDLAENGYLKYLEWEHGVLLTTVESELQLVSEKYRFGGTVDLYCRLTDISAKQPPKMTLVDFKTGQSGIFPEHAHQTAGGYRLLLEESGRPVDQVLIIRVGKSEAMDLETKWIGNWDLHANIFLACLHLHDAKKTLSKIEKDRR
jgi:hypothetical protein